MLVRGGQRSTGPGSDRRTPSVRAPFLNLIKALQSDIGFATLFISHNLAAVRHVARGIAVMNQGEIVAQAPGAGFYAPMSDPYVRRLQQASGLVAADVAEAGT